MSKTDLVPLPPGELHDHRTEPLPRPVGLAVVFRLRVPHLEALDLAPPAEPPKLPPGCDSDPDSRDSSSGRG